MKVKTLFVPLRILCHGPEGGEEADEVVGGDARGGDPDALEADVQRVEDPELPARLRQRVRRVLQHVAARAEHVVLQERLPVQARREIEERTRG